MGERLESCRWVSVWVRRESKASDHELQAPVGKHAQLQLD